MNLFNHAENTNLTTRLAYVSLYFILAILSACTNTQPQPKAYSEPLPVNNEIIFDCFSINHAWGYQMSGFFIDGNGMVYRYKRQGTVWHPKPVIGEKQRYYDKSDLLNKFTNKSLAAKVDSVIMQSKSKLIDLADTGAVSHTKHKIADAGQNLCLAYRYDHSNTAYRPVALGSFGVGQSSIINSSAAAKTLLNWLINDVAKQITGSPRF
ncbi:MAG: hypothetical protein IPN42_12920 [Methylococcaceae bacterium]|nr:hypothetical protein [Methylococcaceae bacterium]